MSNETMEKEDQELAELKEQIEQAAEKELKESQAAQEPEPSPAIPEPEAPPAPKEPAPVTPSSQDTGDKDPMEWAKKKGFKSPEDMARALLQKEQEFHKSKQKEAQPPAWQPAPQMPMPNYGYPPPLPPIQQVASFYPQLAPEDIQKVMPLIVDAAEMVAQRRTQGLERQMQDMQRMTSRNNELMTLMQDPAFRDSRIQKEIHQILDSDPSIFQREQTPLVYAFKEAVFNMGRRQLQQGVSTEEDVKGNKPPVTAGGGNGSANTVPHQPTEREMERWSDKEMKAYIQSNGKIIPKPKGRADL